MKEVVILLHGIGRTDRSMRTLEKHFTHAGYEVINVHYPSRRYALADLCEWLQQKLADYPLHDYETVHFVTHSMGGLLARAYCKKYRPANMGRLVMLGSPNHGSELADFLSPYFVYRFFFGPAGQQLTTHYDLTPVLGAPDYDIGIIAGNKTFSLLTQWIFHQPNDGMVSVQSTMLAQAADHIVLPIDHIFIITNTMVMQQALQFLRHGKFTACEPLTKKSPSPQ